MRRVLRPAAHVHEHRHLRLSFGRLGLDPIELVARQHHAGDVAHVIVEALEVELLVDLALRAVERLAHEPIEVDRSGLRVAHGAPPSPFRPSTASYPRTSPTRPGSITLRTARATGPTYAVRLQSSCL